MCQHQGRDDSTFYDYGSVGSRLQDRELSSVLIPADRASALTLFRCLEETSAHRPILERVARFAGTAARNHCSLGHA